ncbi:MAG: YqaJ viral recombinase family protein [Victivallales bacterium]|nr:YqaJ viral recombinase family protein [Victivallales bacterium]
MTMTVDRQEFLERRKSGIGGSDVAVVLGLSKWKTPYQLWQEKTGKIVIDDDDKSELFHFGNVLEDVIAQEFARRNDVQVQRRNRLFRADNCLIANIDRYIVGKNAILECKTADKFTRHLWGAEEDGDEIPEYYLTQVMHYMYVTNYRDSHLAVLIGGNEYRQFHIEYNADLAEMLAEKCVNFWTQHVLADIPPAAINNEDLLEMYKASSGKVISANERIIESVESLKVVKDQLKGLEEQKENLEFEIKSFMADADTLVSPDGAKFATWKKSITNRLDTKKIKAELPEVAEQYTSQSVSRRFLLK